MSWPSFSEHNAGDGPLHSVNTGSNGGSVSFSEKKDRCRGWSSRRGLVWIRCGEIFGKEYIKGSLVTESVNPERGTDAKSEDTGDISKMRSGDIGRSYGEPACNEFGRRLGISMGVEDVLRGRESMPGTVNQHAMTVQRSDRRNF